MVEDGWTFVSSPDGCQLSRNGVKVDCYHKNGVPCVLKASENNQGQLPDPSTEPEPDTNSPGDLSIKGKGEERDRRRDSGCHPSSGKSEPKAGMGNERAAYPSDEWIQIKNMR